MDLFFFFSSKCYLYPRRQCLRFQCLNMHKWRNDFPASGLDFILYLRIPYHSITQSESWIQSVMLCKHRQHFNNTSIRNEWKKEHTYQIHLFLECEKCAAINLKISHLSLLWLFNFRTESQFKREFGENTTYLKKASTRKLCSQFEFNANLHSGTLASVGMCQQISYILWSTFCLQGFKNFTRCINCYVVFRRLNEFRVESMNGNSLYFHKHSIEILGISQTNLTSTNKYGNDFWESLICA